jgi:hypothetical protein
MTNENTLQALADITERIKDQAIENLMNNKSFVSGDLARSIYTEVDEQTLVGKVIVGDWYGITVEEGIGRRAGGIPPIAPIKDWIKRRGLAPKAGATIDGFAIAIARKIGKRGTNPKARPFLAPSVEQVMLNFGNKDLEISMGKDIGQTIEVAYKQNK